MDLFDAQGLAQMAEGLRLPDNVLEDCRLMDYGELIRKIRESGGRSDHRKTTP